MTVQYIIVWMLHVKLSQLKGLGRIYEPVDLLLPLWYLDFSMFYDLLRRKSLLSRLTRHVAQWEQKHDGYQGQSPRSSCVGLNFTVLSALFPHVTFN